jgi:predicted deacylase
MTVTLTTIARTGGKPGPHLLVTGGVHGDEFEAMAAARQFARDLVGGDFRGRVTVVPVVNEAAFALGRRAADDGLDLARTCPGRPDGSITERTAHALSEMIRGADFYIDLHTGGVRYDVLPLAGYTLHPDAEILATQRTMARAMGLPVVWGTDPSLEGRSLSVARDAKVPAIYAEYGGGRAGCDPEGVKAYVRGLHGVMAALGMTERTVMTWTPLVIEDARPQSGHMQAGHPSPADGFFEPHLRPGVRVEKGQLLGTLTDITGDTMRDVVAVCSGLLLTVHVFASVRAGDGLAVVVDAVGG